MNKRLQTYEQKGFLSEKEKGLYLCNQENIYYGNNTKTKYYYNPLNFRLTRILTTRNEGADILQDLNYTFDAVGNIIQQTDNAQQTFYFNNAVVAPTSTYEYDALYRLIKATGRELTALTAPDENDFVNNIPVPNIADNAMQTYTHNYTYDALGNIMQDAWKTYQYNTHNNYLLGNDNIPNQYTYDAHGNMLTMPHLSSLQWNCKDEMTSATNGTFISYYNYDAQGNRTRKTVVKDNIVETRYYVNGYEVYRKHSNQDLKLERKTLNIADDEKVFVRIEQKTGKNEITRYQYDNHLGSACLELDFEGSIISYEEYHPFGTTSYRSGKGETEVSLKRYKYNGKERDEETGLYAYGMRYYAAWLCRFVSVDPLQFEYPELTPFQYASNTPVSAIDLDGCEAFYMTDGTRVGQIGDNTDVRLVNEGISSDDAKSMISIANLLYNNENKEKSFFGISEKINNLINKKIEEYSSDLGTTEEIFLGFASVVHQESNGSQEESLKMGSIVMNFLKDGGSTQLKKLEDIVMYRNSLLRGAQQEHYTAFKELSSDEKNSKFAISAVINALGYARGLSGFSDYSDGANSWDGIDLIDSKTTNAHRNYTWSKSSETLVKKYKEKFNGGVDVSSWTYKDKNFQISAIEIVGKTLFTKVEGGRGEGFKEKTKPTRFK